MDLNLSIIQLLGMGSALAIVVFTFRAYYQGEDPRAAITEVWVNLAIGFAINYAVNAFTLPLVGAELSASDTFWLGWWYTAISLIRQYVIRRWFQDRVKVFAEKASAKVSSRRSARRKHKKTK